MQKERPLERFVTAQNQGDNYRQALTEIREGCKRSHWIWYIFPQIAGLGWSDMCRIYGIADLEEARAYLAHPLLGKRLHEIAEALLACHTDDPEEILGAIDALKVRSCMTLFLQAEPGDTVFQAVLDKLYGGLPDEKTLEILTKQQGRQNLCLKTAQSNVCTCRETPTW